MFRTTHIRTKLAVALAVPLVALVALSSLEVVAAMRDVDATNSQTELAASSVGPASLVSRLQDERNRASIDLIGLGAAAGLPVATNAEARALVDEAAPLLEGELRGRGPEAQAAFGPAWEAFASLDQLRADVDAYTGSMDLSNNDLADEVFNRYTDIIEAFFDASSTVALAVDDAALRNGVEIIDAAARQSEMRARIVRRIVLAVATGETGPNPGQDVAALVERGRGFDDSIRANATGTYAGIADATFADAGVQGFNRQVEGFLAGEAVSITDLLGAVRSEPDTGYLGLRNRTTNALAGEAGRIQGDAVERQRLFGGIALGGVLFALVVTWLASRSITRPLTSLRMQAEEMAGSKLPTLVRRILETPAGEDVVIPEVDPIVVKSRDEVAAVAAALSAVQASAVDLAVEQTVLRRNISDSYINLGRRNQNLLSRQLDFITDLERNESDPDTLEGLFRLDHLATRMRRNAESLLVLSGVEPPRQWSAPVKVSDVVRAALGEVEDYQRAIVRNLEPASVTGAVAADIAHVLAELIENGLSFSPPEQTVEVKGRLTTSGYTIAISDNGLGMLSTDLERANRRLAGKESFTVAPSRYLGHYVAGHLASRLGVIVELQDSPAGGITARVDIPMGLLANEETDPRLVKLQAQATPPAAPQVARQQLAPATEPATPPTAAPAEPTRTAGGLPRRGGRHAAPAIDLDAPAPRPAPTSDAPRHFAGQGAAEPSIAERSVAEPAVADPAVADPAVADPAVAEPAVAEPAVAEPAVAERSVAEPAVAERSVAEPEVSEVPVAEAPMPAPTEVAPAAGGFDEDADDAMERRIAEARERLVTEPSLWQTARPEPPVITPPPAAGQPQAEEPFAPVTAAEPTVETAPPATPAGAPADPLPARGFGGLAVTRPIGGSMYSVAANNARQQAAGAADAAAGGDDARTRTGLTRRVPGAQRPDAAFGASGARGGEPTTPSLGQPSRTSPEDVYSFLSNFQSGVARGRVDAHTDADTDTPEDRR